MKRLNDTLMGQTGFAAEYQAPLINLVHGGQFGYNPDFTALVSSAPYVKRNMVARLIEAPRGFSLLPESQDYINILKSLVELHPRSIEGITSGLTADFASVPVGGAGEEQEIVSNVTRARTVPVFTYDERVNKPIQAFFNFWIRMFLMDPDSKYPAINSVIDNVGEEGWLPDMQSMTVLFFEPDPTHTRVVSAWLCTNMQPKTDGPNEGRRDLTAAGDVLSLPIEFTSVTMSNYGVRVFAQRLLDEMNMSGNNPNNVPAFVQQISADVRAGTTGYAEKIEETARTTQNP